MDGFWIARRYGSLNPRRVQRNAQWSPTPKKQLKRLALWQTNPHCHWCGKKLCKRECTIEHILPRSEGGGDHLENLALSCERYNQSRQHKGALMCGHYGPIYAGWRRREKLGIPERGSVTV